jgi:hypothetical protein
MGEGAAPAVLSITRPTVRHVQPAYRRWEVGR